jgi:transposase
MELTLAQSVGVDISKDALDVAVHPVGQTFRVANDRDGHFALVRRLRKLDVARIVFEGYGRLSSPVRADARRGRPAARQRSILARPDASLKAAGKLAKTDRCDARMGAALELEPGPPVSPTVEAAKELVKARGALVKDRVAALNRQATAVSPLIKRQLVHRLRQIDRQIEAIDRELRALRNADGECASASTSWPPSRALARRPPMRSWSRRPNAGVSTMARSQAAQGLLQSQGTAAKPWANGRSAAVE